MKVFLLFVLLGAALVSHASAQESSAKLASHQCASLRRDAKLPRFSDFPASNPLRGKPASPILSTPQDRKFRRVIRTAAANGANFAGHYAIAAWGCGTGCQQFVVVDLNSGYVSDPDFKEVDYHYPPMDIATESEWWCYPDVLNFRQNSDLLIVEGCLEGKQCGRSYFRMESSKLHVVHYDGDLTTDGKIAPF